MRIDIAGLFHGYKGAKRGDVVEVDDENGARYCSLGYAQQDLRGELGRAYLPSP
jgi:hypothetical protein